MKTELCLIRHGETQWNRQQRMQGQTDIALTSTGHHQARQLAKSLSGQLFDILISSDLVRALQTAAPLAHTLRLPIQQHTGLRERHLGCFQGLTRQQAKQRYPEPYRRYRARDPEADLPQGETLRVFYSRIQNTLDHIVRQYRAGRLLLICHAGVLDAIYRIVTGLSLQASRQFALPNCAINRLIWDTAGWQIEQWADTEHLDSADYPPEHSLTQDCA